MKKVFNNIMHMGNTTACHYSIALSEAGSKERIKKVILFV